LAACERFSTLAVFTIVLEERMTSVSRVLIAAATIAVGGTSALAVARHTGPAAAPEMLPPGFSMGTPGLQSAGALTFGPGGVLFVGDSRAGAVFALAVDDATPDTHRGEVELANIDRRIASLLGMAPDQLVIRDMAVNPITEHLFFSVSRGRGADAPPAIVRSTLTGELTVVPLDHARFSKLALSDAPAETAKTPWGASSRSMAITDLAFTGGELLIAGLSNDAFSSTLRRARFPFSGGSRATTLEIFHTSHGKYETAAPIETFLPYQVKGQPALLAGYGCAPLALFTMSELNASKHVRGRTLAELGGGNRPQDMIAFERDGTRFVLIANSNRGVMRMSAADIDRSEPIVTPATRDVPITGTSYVPLALPGVMQLDLLNPELIVMLMRDIDDGTVHVRSFPTKYL
jgi:hypothetical protein